MTTETIVLAAAQGLLALVIAILAWWGHRQTGRIDQQERRGAELSERVAVHSTKISGTPTAEAIRSVVREELDRALRPVQRDLDDLRVRVRSVEESRD